VSHAPIDAFTCCPLCQKFVSYLGWQVLGFDSISHTLFQRILIRNKERKIRANEQQDVAWIEE